YFNSRVNLMLYPKTYSATMAHVCLYATSCTHKINRLLHRRNKTTMCLLRKVEYQDENWIFKCFCVACALINLQATWTLTSVNGYGYFLKRIVLKKL
ncbi:hypothetical protein L9F63_006111, partial [Diploptera punctata]